MSKRKKKKKADVRKHFKVQTISEHCSLFDLPSANTALKFPSPQDTRTAKASQHEPTLVSFFRKTLELRTKA